MSCLQKHFISSAHCECCPHLVCAVAMNKTAPSGPGKIFACTAPYSPAPIRDALAHMREVARMDDVSIKTRGRRRGVYDRIEATIFKYVLH